MNEDEQDYPNSGREDGGEAIPIDVDSTFTKDGRWPGTVKIVVEATTFWYALTNVPAGMATALLLLKHIPGFNRAHRDILVFASPFFEAALSGR